MPVDDPPAEADDLGTYYLPKPRAEDQVEELHRVVEGEEAAVVQVRW